MRAKTTIGIGIIFALLLTTTALAQVSTNFDLGWWTVVSGGGSRGSTHYQVVDSLGQPGVGKATSTGHWVQAGFLAGAITPTPAPSATPSPVLSPTPSPTLSPTPSPAPGATPQFRIYLPRVSR